MDQVDVIWKSYHEPEAIARGYWDQGLLEDLLSGSGFKHLTDFHPYRTAGSIVVINGRMHAGDVRKINDDIAKLPWVLLIITGDEESLFPWTEIHHPRMRLWVQLPRLHQHNDVAFKLPNGYRPNTRASLDEIGYQQRTRDYFFAGQVNHPRRQECVDAIKSLPPGMATGTAVSTEGFGREKIAYRDYLKLMAQTKIVLCPSGIETPDTFRLYEALEAGCLPIVDAHSTRNPVPGFWTYLFGEDPPFPVIDHWSNLPRLLPQILKEYPQNASRAFAWWQRKKRDMRFKLTDTVKELSQ